MSLFVHILPEGIRPSSWQHSFLAEEWCFFRPILLDHVLRGSKLSSSFLWSMGFSRMGSRRNHCSHSAVAIQTILPETRSLPIHVSPTRNVESCAAFGLGNLCGFYGSMGCELVHH